MRESCFQGKCKAGTTFQTYQLGWSEFKSTFSAAAPMIKTIPTSWWTLWTFVVDSDDNFFKTQNLVYLCQKPSY